MQNRFDLLLDLQLKQFVFLHSLGGVREGTLLAALLVGTLARFINKLVLPLRGKYL